MVLPDLFGDVVDPSVKVGDRGFRSLPVSVLLHAMAVAAVALLALASTESLPSPPAVMAFLAPMGTPAPPPPSPPPRAAVASRAEAAVQNPAAAPVAAPAEIRPETGLEPTAAGVPGGVEGGIPGGIVAGAGIVALPDAPPPAPLPPAEPLRVGGNIRPPTKIRDMPPIYPRIAIQARVQGVVIVEANISPEGRVVDARILRSIPVLDEAALDAVRQWEYTPTLLNGVPRAVVMTVTVTFQLVSTGANPR